MSNIIEFLPHTGADFVSWNTSRFTSVRLKPLDSFFSVSKADMYLRIDINIIPDWSQCFYVKNYLDIHNHMINWRVKSILSKKDPNLLINQQYWMNINCTKHKWKLMGSIFHNLLNTVLTVVSAIRLSRASFINQTIITNKETTLINFMIFTSHHFFIYVYKDAVQMKRKIVRIHYKNQSVNICRKKQYTSM